MGILLNQRRFFNSDWDGRKVSEHAIIKIDIDKLVEFACEYLDCSLENLQKEIELSLSAAYSMNPVTFQSKTDKKIKLKILRDKIENAYKDLSLPVEARVQKEQEFIELYEVLDRMKFEKPKNIELEDSKVLNKRNRMSWQTKHALHHLRGSIESLASGKKLVGKARRMFNGDPIRESSMSNTVALAMALLNYMGVHVTYDQAISFYGSNESLDFDREYNSLFGKLDWKYFLEKLVSK